MGTLDLRARTLAWWAIVIPLLGFFFSMDWLGPRIVLPILAVLYLAQLYVFAATTCPNCGCYILGRIAKTPAFIAPFWIPRECLCCSHDLTDFPEATRTMAVYTRKDRADVPESADANRRIEKLERENKELKSEIKRLEALGQDAGAVAGAPEDTPTH